MKLTISSDNIHTRLTIEPQTIAEAFSLGELWGEWNEKIEMSWGGDATLHFDLKPQPIDETVVKPS